MSFPWLSSSLFSFCLSIALAQNPAPGVANQCSLPQWPSYLARVLILKEVSFTEETIKIRRFEFESTLYSHLHKIDQGKIATFECQAGYTLIGASHLRCITGPNGSAVWDRDFPECKGNVCWWIGIQDDSLLEFHYSGQKLSAVRSNKFPVGTVITYLPGMIDCSPGLVIKTLPSSVCSGEGKWIDRPQPCVEDPNWCAWDSTEENVTFQFQGKSLPGNATRFPPLTEMTSLKPIECPSKYSFAGRLVKLCKNGSWSVTNYPCQFAGGKFCVWDGPMENVKFRLNGNVFHSKSNQFPDGTRVIERFENVVCPAGCTAQKTSVKLCSARQWIIHSKSPSNLTATDENDEEKGYSCIGYLLWGLIVTLLFLALLLYILKPVFTHLNVFKGVRVPPERKRPIDRTARVSIVHHVGLGSHENDPIYESISKIHSDQTEEIYSDVTTPSNHYDETDPRTDEVFNQNALGMYSSVVPKSKRAIQV